MGCRILLVECNGVKIPDSFQNRYYDKRPHEKRIKECICGIKFYDESIRVTKKECATCTRIKFTKNSIDLLEAEKNHLRHKVCKNCGSPFLDTSYSRAKNYCVDCLTKYSYDVINSLVKQNGDHPNFKSYDIRVFDDKVKNAYDGFKTDVKIASEIGITADQVSYIRKKLGLATIKPNLRRINLGYTDLNSLDKEEALRVSRLRLKNKDIAIKYGVKPSTIKSKFKSLDVKRASIEYDISNITEHQRNIIIGHLLGDGCLIPDEKRRAAYFKVSHKIGDDAYSKWSTDQLSSLKLKFFKGRKISEGRLFESSGLITIRYGDFISLYDLFYKPELKAKYGKDGFKAPNIDIFTNLSDLSLAVWYMDDGSYDSGNPNFATNFPGCDIQEICSALSKQFTINFFPVKRQKNVHLIKIRGANDKKRFFDIIKPYMQPCMGRKLPPVFRNAEAYKEDTFSTKYPISEYYNSDKDVFINKVVSELLTTPFPYRSLDNALPFHDNFGSKFRNPGSLNYIQLAKDIFPVQTMPQGAILFYLDNMIKKEEK